MYFVVQGQVIMLIALSRASCKFVLFFCVEIVQLFVVTMILCFFSLNETCSRLFQKTEESGSERIRFRRESGEAYR